VVAKSGRILNVGCNEESQRPGRYTRSASYRSLHSEIAACLGLDRDILKGADVYNYRETKGGSRTISKPCASCQRELSYLGIRRVFYSTPEGYEVIKL
jgi:deoxycytidylate deaminase